MTAAISGTPENTTLARFVARSTEAETTPGVAEIAFSTRATQESQAMPSTRTLKAAGFFGLEEKKDIGGYLLKQLKLGQPFGYRSEWSGTKTRMTEAIMGPSGYCVFSMLSFGDYAEAE
jgi:hypothetical protein